MMSSARSTVDLTRYAWLSIGAAVVTIALKYGAYALTGSVSLLSDAIESVVNVVAAIVALISLRLAAKPANSRFTYGRSKAEYFSAAFEGALIFGAAGLIIFTALGRFINPVAVSHMWSGVIVSIIAAVINGATALILLRAGRRHRSPTLVADAKHLFTDIVTSVGVIVGVIAVSLTDWLYLDPLVALIVAAHILYVGTTMMREALSGLMDITLPDDENQRIVDLLNSLEKPGTIAFHGLQTRVAGQERHINFHALVPDDWTVKHGHDFAEDLVAKIEKILPLARVTVHIEPINDPESYRDIPQGYIPL